MKNKTGFLATSAFSFFSFPARLTGSSSLVFTVFALLLFSITSVQAENLTSDVITTTQTSSQDSTKNSSFTYELNSEYTSLKNSSGYQLDNKFLIGYKWNWYSNYSLRTSLGVENYKQSVDSDSRIFTGPLFQLKQTVFENHLYALYEHFEYNDHDDKVTYNKYGLVFFDYRSFSTLLFSDVYAESFYMPAVSTRKLLTTARASIYLAAPIQALPANYLALLSEVYHKNSPDNWGGEYTDLRLGVRVQPFSFISVKAFSAVLSTQDPNDKNFEFQVNVFYQGDF